MCIRDRTLERAAARIISKVRTVAWHLLAEWDTARERFVKVLPKDYGRVLRALAEAEAAGLSGDEAVMAAFEANRRDLARVGGN